MEKMRKLLNSPMSRRRQAPPPPPYIGATLDEVSRRENCPVPKLITKVCSFINENGLEMEGIFRINGNSKVVDRLRAAFDKGNGDSVELEDVMAAASLLKLFLRELPEGVITHKATAIMVAKQQEFARDKKRCVRELSDAVQCLPAANLAVLQYLTSFLVRVSLRQSKNKMSAMALGIVFGPNLFRCSDGLVGLQQQGITNHIVSQLITHYDDIFLAHSHTGLVSPYSPNFKLDVPGKVAPPRPPPPRQGSNGSQSNGSEEEVQLDGEIIERAQSPFILESETPRSDYTPRQPGTTEVVEKAISSVIGQRLFGDDESSAAPTPAPRSKRSSGIEIDGSEDDEEEDDVPTVQQRIQQLQPVNGGGDADNGKDQKAAPRKRRPNSQAFQMFESTGMIIGMGPGETKDDSPTDGDSRPVPKPRSPRKAPRLMNSAALTTAESSSSSSQDSVHAAVSNEDAAGFEDIDQPKGKTLTGFKRPRGPKNRRVPSRQSLKRSGSEEEVIDDPTDAALQHIKEEEHGAEDEDAEDLNHNEKQPSIKFLDVHHNGQQQRHHHQQQQQQQQQQNDQSPAVQHKPYVPPLDLSTLHEHADGSDPLPATVPQSQQHGDPASSDALVSPRIRTLQLHKTNAKDGSPETEGILSPLRIVTDSTSACPDIDVPPSPPMDHHGGIASYSNMSGGPGAREDGLVKQLMKKIQSYKRKIKAFEESFESEHGYRPSQTDKAAQSDIKRFMQDLAKTRRELKRVKEEIAAAALPSSSPGPAGVMAETVTAWGTGGGGTEGAMEETLSAILNKLEDKRRDAGRPEDIALMSPEQIQEEKLAVQKALLHFEGIHGRPTTKSEKEVMRPLYDRYRNIKRSLNKSTPTSATSVDSVGGELQSVPEHHTMDFPDQPRQQGATGAVGEEGGDVFLVTKDMRLLRNSTLRDPGGGGGGGGGRGSTTTITEEEDEDDEYEDGATASANESHRNLHVLTLKELQQELQVARGEKKRLRKLLRAFEEEFFQRFNRRVQKEDRLPKETEYHQYKQVKSRLKLLDALIAKHEPPEP